MSVPAPHYILFSKTSGAPDSANHDASHGGSEGCGQWEFVLESLDGKKRIKVADRERSVAGQRLELLAVVRGLEALDQPSRVTLLTSSAYVLRGMRFGLAQWREDDWQWESFGRMTPIRNADLWRRLDRALRIHRVKCRSWRVDLAHTRVDLAHTHAMGQPNHEVHAKPVRRDPVRPQPSRSQPSASFWGRLFGRPAVWFERTFGGARLCADQ